MKIGIMQPYFFPYIGYWQLIHAVDKFVIYDNIQYSKGGWINRNRILVEGKDKFITLPLKKASDYLDIQERLLADNFPSVRGKLLNQIYAAYRKAPHFEEVYPLILMCMEYENPNLFQFLFHTIQCLMKYMDIKTEIFVSSKIERNSGLKKEKRVIALCKTLEGTQYINPIGGTSLYEKCDFVNEGLTLNFIKPCINEYVQGPVPFVPNLSIIDVLMHNSQERIQEMLNEYVLL